MLVGGTGCLGLTCDICGTLLSHISIERPTPTRHVFDVLRRIVNEVAATSHRVEQAAIS